MRFDIEYFKFDANKNILSAHSDYLIRKTMPAGVNMYHERELLYNRIINKHPVIIVGKQKNVTYVYVQTDHDLKNGLYITRLKVHYDQQTMVNDKQWYDANGMLHNFPHVDISH